MEQTCFSHSVTRLETPVGTFRIQQGEQCLPFYVEPNPISGSIPVRNDEKQIIGSIWTETNYRVTPDLSQLEIGQTYTITFSNGNWSFCESDEHTECYDTVIDNWTVGIGAYDPNDDEKLRQEDVSPNLREYDESTFRQYVLEPMEDYNGFSFRLLDKSESPCFLVSWVQICEYPVFDYENALGYWLT